MILVSLLLAYLTYSFVELPIRKIKRRDLRRKAALGLLGCVSATALFGVVVISMRGIPSRLPSAIVALDHDYAQDISSSWREGSCYLRPEQSPSSFSDVCLDSSAGSSPSALVLVWGDSHAADLLPGLRALQKQSRIRLAQYTASTCPPIIGLEVHERPACIADNSAVLARLSTLRPDIVVLSARWSFFDLDHDAVAESEKFSRTIALVRAAGVKRIVVLGSAPYWTESVPGLLNRELYRHPGIPAPHRLARNLLQPQDDTLLKAVTLNQGGHYVSILDSLCDATTCLATTGSTWREVVTFDQSHFTNHGSELLAQQIWPSIVGPSLK